MALVMMPMFLFFTTFFPLGIYPRWLQMFVECALWRYQGIEIIRGLMLGVAGSAWLGRVFYLAVLGMAGLVVVSRRLGRLVLS
ncbi:hypothetical protein [Actinocrinis sp.]|uniref:hypothetical protein n=1 Tax=Actinocrinis sp. TaxID=1920516 RepID=UPI002DDD7BFA|nr:hypothetical protein [Actinocrinis sp.]